MTTAADLPTARLRQLRDGHDPDDGTAGRARATRIARLQADVIAADQLADELERYRQAAWRIDVRAAVRRLVDREIRRMIDRATGHRDRLNAELRALQ